MRGGMYGNSLVVELNSSFLGAQGSSPNEGIQFPRLRMEDPRQGIGWRIQDWEWDGGAKTGNGIEDPRLGMCRNFSSEVEEYS